MLTQERLKELLQYDPDTGIFYRKTSTTNRVKAGDIAGTLRKDNYVRIMVDGRLYLAHRLVWLYVYGELPKVPIDHINTIKSDNRISNLRKDDGNWNNQNIRTSNRNNKLGILGVSRKGKKFRATIVVNGKRKHIGSYDTPEEAHEAYIEAKRKYHPGNTL